MYLLQELPTCTSEGGLGVDDAEHLLFAPSKTLIPRLSAPPPLGGAKQLEAPLFVNVL